MYYYRRRTNGNTLLLGLLITGIAILLISPRARRKVGSCFGTLSFMMMDVGKDIGRKVTEVSATITDKFRTYKLSDLTGGFMRTYTASKGSKAASKDEDEGNIYFHDLTSRENQIDDDDDETNNKPLQ